MCNAVAQQYKYAHIKIRSNKQNNTSIKSWLHASYIIVTA